MNGDGGGTAAPHAKLKFLPNCPKINWQESAGSSRDWPGLKHSSSEHKRIDVAVSVEGFSGSFQF